MSPLEQPQSEELSLSARLPLVMAGGLAVFLLAMLGVEMTRAAGNVASIWLPNVVALGVMLRVSGLSRAVSFVLSGGAVFAANLLHGDSVGLSLGLTGANLIELGLAAVLLSSIGFRRGEIVTPSGFLRFVLVVGLAGPLAGGLAGSFTLHELVGAPMLPVFQTWVFSGVLGAVIIGPAVIAPVTFAMDRRPLALWEIAGWSCASALIVWFTTQPGFGFLVYLLPGLVIAAGIRLGLTASGMVGAVLAVYVAWNIATGAGNLPFSGDLLSGQVFLLTACAASHIVALLWHQRVALESEKENYVRAVQAAHDGILFIDADDRFVAWNDALERMFPWLPENRNMGLPQFRDDNLTLLSQLKAGQNITEVPISRPDGRGGTREYLISAAPFLEGGFYQGAAVTVRDVTETEELRQTARRRAAELEAFIDSTPDIVIGTDSEGTITVWNRTAEVFHGLPRTETMGTRIYDLGPSEKAREIRRRNFNRVMQGESINNVRSMRRRADGVERELMLSIHPVVDERGRIAGSLANHRDVTELTRLQHDVALTQKLLDNAFSAVSDGLAIFDAEEILVRCNDAYADLIGYRNSDHPIGKSWEEIVRRNLRDGNIAVAEENWDEWVENRRAIIAEGGSSFVMQLRDKRWLLGNDYPIEGGGFICVRQDVSELKETQESLELSNRELEQFAFVASHDLQEPLRKINSFGSILVADYKDLLPEDGQMFVDTMMRAANRMQNLIQDLLTYSRLQKLGAEGTLCDLTEFVKTVVSDLDVQIREAGATVLVADLGVVHMDRTSLIRVIQNIVVNAIKYRKPDVPVLIEIVPASDEAGLVGFTVRDNGRGFDMRHAEQIMEPFKRLHSQSEIAGTGMGLAIVQRVLQASGGKLKVKAEAGAGAEFTVLFPREAAPD